MISYTQQFDLSSIDFFDRRFALTMETVCVESVNVAPDSGAQFVNVVRYVLHNIINNIPWRSLKHNIKVQMKPN